MPDLKACESQPNPIRIAKSGSLAFAFAIGLAVSSA
jgi:hypothetical protein